VINKDEKNKLSVATLYYLVGASGSGKDSILRYFRDHLAKECRLPVAIAHRYIPRQTDATENSVMLSEQEFTMRAQEKLFALNWQANTFHYGIGVEINTWLEAGVSVIVNGSRAYLPIARSLYPKQLHSINIDVPDEILQQRLQKRSRETPSAIISRMQRHKQLKEIFIADSVIVNDSSIDHAAIQLQEIINNKG